MSSVVVAGEVEEGWARLSAGLVVVEGLGLGGWGGGEVEGNGGGIVGGCLGVSLVAVAGEVEAGWARLSAGLVVVAWGVGACGGVGVVC